MLFRSCVIIGASALGQLAPPLGAFFSAKAAAGSVIEVLKRKPLIDGLSEEGEKPTKRPKGDNDYNFLLLLARCVMISCTVTHSFMSKEFA